MAHEIRFYHLTSSRLEQALPILLQRTLERNWRAVVLTDSAERSAHLNQHLWTFDQGSFLPHGDKTDGDAENQLIWITDEEENPNRAQVIFLLDGMTCAKPELFDLICLVFDGTNNDAVIHARSQWKAWLETSPCPLTYWQQNESGGWEKKASTEQKSRGQK